MRFGVKVIEDGMEFREDDEAVVTGVATVVESV
jgi:hypothetical protein